MGLEGITDPIGTTIITYEKITKIFITTNSVLAILIGITVNSSTARNLIFFAFSINTDLIQREVIIRIKNWINKMAISIYTYLDCNRMKLFRKGHKTHIYGYCNGNDNHNPRQSNNILNLEHLFCFNSAFLQENLFPWQ